jgi:ABC-type antimicrobial peptide transport system permease subunit
MGGLGASFLVRRARSSWLLLACVVITVLLTAGLTAVLWSFADGVVPTGAQGALAAPQSRSLAISGVDDAGEAATDSQLIRATFSKAWPGVSFQMVSALWGEPLELPSPGQSTPPTVGSNAGQPGTPGGPPAQGPTITEIRVASLEGISAQTTLTAGTWPGPPHHGGPLPVALPAAAASQLHLTVGSVLTGSPTSGQAPVSMRVTGLFEARDPASTYWGLDLLPASGVSVGSYSSSTAMMTITGSTINYGPAVVNPAAFDGALAAAQGSWEVLPQAPAMARGNIAALATGTDNAISQLNVALPDGLQVTSGLPQLLTGMASTIVLTRSLFTIAALMLLLVAGAALVLVARLLASLREEESALLRARGATRWQVTRPTLVEAVVLGAVAALAGVLAGTRLTGVLAGLGNLRLEDSPGGITALAWLSALVILVLCAAVMAWPALRAPAPGEVRRRRSRQARLAGIAWAGGDLALVALAAIAVWQLHGYSAVAHPATGSLGIDPVVAIAPALALAGVAVIPLRGLPLLARLADKATDHERRLAAAMVSWQIARRPIRQAGPALLVVVATATTTLAVAGYASWRQSTFDQASFTVGSDVRVDSAGALSPGDTGAITRAPGVTAATEASVASIPNGSQLIALDASTADKAILLRPDLSPLPLSALWQGITPPPSGLALPGQPERLELTAALGAGPQTTAAEVQSGLGSVDVAAWIQDSGGATYQIPAAAPLPADDRPHSLVFTLAGPRQGGYRLIGFTLTWVLPPYDPARPTYAPSGAFTIESLAVAGTASGPFASPFIHGAALKAWQLANASSGAVPTGPSNPNGGPLPPSDGNPPSFLGWHSAPGDGQRLTFNAGHDPSVQVELEVPAFNPASAMGQVTITAQPKDQAIPAIATSGYLTANHLGIGSYTTVSLGFPATVQATVQIVASVAHFPTVFGQNRALITDLADTNDVLVANAAMPLPVTRWWLSTAGGRIPRLPAGLGLSVTERASQQTALFGNPLLTAPRQAMLAIGAAAVLLGVLGFSVSVAASLRSRRTQSAVFAALGVGKNAQAGQLCLEQCALSFPAAAAGLLAGIGLAQLMVPAITLTAGSTAPLPPALVILPLGWAVALALVTAALPVVAAALSVLSRPDPAAQLRAEAG